MEQIAKPVGKRLWTWRHMVPLFYGTWELRNHQWNEWKAAYLAPP